MEILVGDMAAVTLEVAGMDSETASGVAISTGFMLRDGRKLRIEKWLPECKHWIFLDITLKPKVILCVMMCQFRCRENGVSCKLFLMLFTVCNQGAEVEDMEVEMATTMALVVMVCDLFLICYLNSLSFFFSPLLFILLVVY